MPPRRNRPPQLPHAEQVALIREALPHVTVRKYDLSAAGYDEIADLVAEYARRKGLHVRPPTQSAVREVVLALGFTTARRTVLGLDLNPCF